MKITRTKIGKDKNGYAVLELLFYISFFAVLIIVVINSMITMTRAFRETMANGELVQAGNVVEKISREIRQAYNLTLVSATDLKLDTTDDSGNNKTVEFLLSGSNLQYLENSTLTGNLNTSNIVINSLTFNSITTTNGSAVKLTLAFTRADDSNSTQYTFYDTVALRGEY